MHDWELASTGPPIADLAYVSLQFHMPPQELAGVTLPGLKGVDPAGVPSEEEFLSLYGWQQQPAHWSAYIALGALRLASIAQV